jgi:PadR family transcriptional regulator, regulatory protein PadR
MRKRQPSSTALLQGTLDVLIPEIVALEPMRGLGISRGIAQETFRVKGRDRCSRPSTGWLSAEWGEFENSPRDSASSRKRPSQWTRISAAMASALETM